MEELKKELMELVDKLSMAETNRDCNILLGEIDKKVWLVYHNRYTELLNRNY